MIPQLPWLNFFENYDEKNYDERQFMNDEEWRKEHWAETNKLRVTFPFSWLALVSFLPAASIGCLFPLLLVMISLKIYHAYQNDDRDKILSDNASTSRWLCYKGKIQVTKTVVNCPTRRSLLLRKIIALFWQNYWRLRILNMREFFPRNHMFWRVKSSLTRCFPYQNGWIFDKF